MAEWPNSGHTGQSGMDPTSTQSHRRPTRMARARCSPTAGRLLCATAIWAVVALATSPRAHAHDYTLDIITPSGWEACPPHCPSTANLAGSELMIPVGWGDTAPTGATWAAPTCSDLMAPAEWTHTPLRR
jgi:hypothetical protein